MSLPKIGIIIGTTRPGRFADGVASWLMSLLEQRKDAAFEIVDLRDYPLPFFEERLPLIYEPPKNEVARRWAAKMDSLDGYIFLTAEYNHSISGVLKNALDHAYFEYNRKPATFVGYGGQGAARAVEQLRLILAELQVASLKHSAHINAVEMLGVMREGKKLADYPYLAEAVTRMADELVWWANALRSARATTPTSQSATH
jgi:NAD(P)H-dependent FMN reductase